MDKFKGKTNFEKKIKAFKVYAKRDKNGNSFMMGKMTANITVLIQKNTLLWVI